MRSVLFMSHLPCLCRTLHMKQNANPDVITLKILTVLFITSGTYISQASDFYPDVYLIVNIYNTSEFI